MTDTPVTETKTEATPAPVAAAPVVDMEAITTAATNAAEKKAAEVATSRLKQAAKILSGEKEKDDVNPLAVQMIQNPEEYSHSLKELTKKELREEIRRDEQHRSAINAVAAPFVQEYPEVNTRQRMAYVQTLAEDIAKTENLPITQALDKAFKTAVKELQLQSVTDAARASSYGNTGLPSVGGGMRQAAPQFDAKKSESDFIAGLQARSAATRNRPAPKK